MKLSSLHGLEKVDGNTILVVAREPFDRESAENILVGDAEPSVVLGESARGLMDELESGSLFSTQRVVVLRGAERLPAAAAQELARYCERPNLNVTLVMLAATRPHVALYKGAEVVVDIAAGKPWEQERMLAEWLVGEARARGKQFPAAAQLAATVGSDKLLLTQELEKLITFVGEAPLIDGAAVAAIAVGTPTEAVWALGQAILARDACRAVRVWRDLAAQKVAPLAVVATLRSQINKGLTLASMAARGASRQEMGKALPQLREKALYRSLQEAQGYGIGQLREALIHLSALELQLKNQKLPEATVIDLLICRLAA